MVFQRMINVIADFDAWKPGFINHGDSRKKFTCKGTKVYTDPGNNKNVTIILEWGDAEKMKEFGNSDDLKKAMKKAGVTAPPEIKVSNSNDFDVSGLKLQFETDG